MRRGATIESHPRFNRRYATNARLAVKPWLESHGYHRQVAPRLQIALTLPFGRSTTLQERQPLLVSGKSAVRPDQDDAKNLAVLRNKDYAVEPSAMTLKDKSKL